MKNCIFCRIIKGEIPCHKIYEDADVLAFLDIHPVTKGHTLLIPKKHFPALFETDDEVLKQIILTIKKIAPKIQQALNARAVHVAVAGEDVPHTHIHLMPRYENDGIKWPRTGELKEEDAPKIIKQIKNLLK